MSEPYEAGWYWIRLPGAKEWTVARCYPGPSQRDIERFGVAPDNQPWRCDGNLLWRDDIAEIGPQIEPPAHPDSAEGGAG